MADNLSLTFTEANGTVVTVTGNIVGGTLVVTPPAVVPPPPPPAIVEPVIPTAATKVSLDANTTWKAVWDTSTPKTATGTTTATAGGRQFTVNYTNRAGVRFSCHAAASGGQGARNVVYETTCTFNWSQISRFELDTNIVADAKRVFMLCLQQQSGSPTGSGMWDLTFNGHWVGSNVRAPLSQWADGSTHTIRTHASVDDNGVVTYIGVSVDGVYSPFKGNNVGPGIMGSSWSPVGLIVPNFQFEGSGAAGTITGTASINLYWW